MEENTLINCSTRLVSGSDGENLGDYCSSDDSTAIPMAYGCYSDYDDDNGSWYERKDVSFVWDGWEAALIVSKRNMACQVDARDYYAVRVPKKEDNTKVMILEEYETHLGKTKARQTLEPEGRGKAIRKVSCLCHTNQAVHDDSWCGPIEEGQYIKIGKAIAVLTDRVMGYAGLRSFKYLISGKAYKIVRESVFNSIAKFVLSVFDMEDFERIYNQRVVKDEFSEFCAKLESCKCDPLVAVAEGKVKVDQFSTLREHDLCVRIQQYQSRADEELLMQYQSCEDEDFFMQYQSCEDEDFFMQYQTSAAEEIFKAHRPWIFLVFDPESDPISPEDIASALEVFRNYDKPLKEDCKMQLTLELTHEKSCRILDTLVLEALRGVNIKELEKNLPKTSDDVFLASEAKYACSVLADGLIVGLYESLALMKASALKDVEKAVIFPLSDVCFGPCTDELTEVIKIANHERRMQGDRFISVKHLLFGLSLSRVGECVERILIDRGLNCLGGFPSKLSSFSIYKLSRDAATILGDKDVGLEHLVLAIFFGKQESDRIGMAAQDDCTSLFLDKDKWDDELLKCLRNSNTECGVESFDDSDAFKSILPEDCLDAAGRPYSCGFFMMEELHKTFECGLKLNAIRE